MKLIDVKDSVLDKFRKRGAIPEWYENDDKTVDIVYIRADGWSCGGTVKALKAQETDKHAWKYVWLPGDNGGDVVEFSMHVGSRDEIQSKEDREGVVEVCKIDDKQNDAGGAKKGKNQRKKSLSNKGW